METFLKMLETQSILFVYMAVGYFCRKVNIFSDEMRARLTDFTVMITLPCMVFKSFLMEFSMDALIQGGVALLYATGMDEEDLKKPFVAVIGSFSEMVPGHAHLQELAEQVCQGVIEAGGVPRRSETIAICDGLCQGHKGMRYPLASRDLIADSVEMVVEAHHFDAMVLLAGCDKIIPGMLMAAARLNIPTVVVPGGPMLPGNVGGNPLFCSSELREFPGRVEAGIITPEYMKEAEKITLPTVGSCAHLGTANSMCMLTEVLGMGIPGSGTAPAVSTKRKRIAKASGRAAVCPDRCH